MKCLDTTNFIVLNTIVFAETVVFLKFLKLHSIPLFSKPRFCISMVLKLQFLDNYGFFNTTTYKQGLNYLVLNSEISCWDKGKQQCIS